MQSAVNIKIEFFHHFISAIHLNDFSGPKVAEMSNTKSDPKQPDADEDPIIVLRALSEGRVISCNEHIGSCDQSSCQS